MSGCRSDEPSIVYWRRRSWRRVPPVQPGRRLACRSIKQIVLSADPVADLFEETVRAQDTDHRAEGEDLDQQLGLVARGVIDRADPGLCLLIKAGMLFVVGEVEHSPF